MIFPDRTLASSMPQVEVYRKASRTKMRLVSAWPGVFEREGERVGGVDVKRVTSRITGDLRVNGTYSIHKKLCITIFTSNIWSY